METELHKLRIEKHHKSRREARPVWPWVLPLIVIAVAALVIWRFIAATPAVVVHVVPVKAEQEPTARGNMVALNATGYVVAAHKIEVASKVVGRVAWVGVEMGDKVTKGQVLVRLEDDEYKAQVAQQQGLLDNARAKLAELEAGSRPQEILQAQAQLAQTESELANAKLNCARMEALAETHSVSQQQIEDAEALVRSRQALADAQRQSCELTRAGPRKEVIDAQRATVRQLEGALALGMVDLDNTVIRSPINATILERNVEVGEFVTTGFVGDRGAKGYVVSIADLDDLRVELDISQNDFAKVSAHQKAWITTDAYPDRKYAGVVDLISPEANRQKATVLVKVKVLAPDGLLKPDMNATVAFLSASPTTAGSDVDHPLIRVSASAIRDGAVYTVENGKALRRPVTTGLSGAGGEIEIKTGLMGGEDLITNPTEALHNGDPVTVEK